MTRISCGAVVNAAGAGGPAIARAVDLDIPVHNKKRMIFTFTCEDEVRCCPLLIDPTGVYVRPEGNGFLCGVAPPADADPDSDDFEVDYSFLTNTFGPSSPRGCPPLNDSRLVVPGPAITT